MNGNMKDKFDFLIVGAGLYGSTFAYEASCINKKCLVIDKRSHIGGNLYCEDIEGINVHKYGAHIFHTSDENLWNYIQTFVKFNRYINSPIALASDGKLYNLPFNMNTFYQIWGTKTPEEAKSKLEIQRLQAKERYGTIPRNLEEQALLLVGSDIYEKLIKEYTEKQWGRPCNKLPPEIIRRIPIRFTFDNNYFNDKFQGVPVGGYNALIGKMLEKCYVRLNCDYFQNKEYFDSLAKQIVYTGPLDQFFNFNCGTLEYRTVTFENTIIDIPNFQGNAVINYTSRDVPYTRIIEHKHFELFGEEVFLNPKTVISKEFPLEWNPLLEPYYPINDEKNNERYNRYEEQIIKLPLINGLPKYIFGGRLAEYRYYDMGPTIMKAKKTISEIYE